MSINKELKDKILIVDDADVNRSMLRTLLERSGYNVDDLSNGEECLHYCQHNPPSVLLLDVMMPGCDGLEVCRLLRKRFSKQELPIILVTALSESSDVKEGFAAGANDYVTKPVEKEVLRARVANQLMLSQSYKALKEQQSVIDHTLRIQQATGDALDQAILVHDSHGNIIHYNVLFAEYCNSQIPGNVADLSAVFFDGRIKDKLQNQIYKIHADQGAVINTSIEEQQGGWLHIKLVSRPISIINSNDYYRIWTFRDVSQLNALEKLNKEKVKLETVSIFAVGIAHNFNNLFAAIMGANDKLKKILVDQEKAGRCLQLISRSVNHGMALTKKMSSLTKRKIDNETLLETPLQPVVDSVIEVSRHVQANAASIRFHLDSAIEHLCMRVEYLNLLDIVSHIVSNAIDSMSNGGELQISVQPSLLPDYVDIQFKDTGCGMSPAVSERVFEPFFSTKNIDHRNGMSMVGNGLGLWNVYNLVKLYGGDIKIQSKLNAGTIVTVTLPLAVSLHIKTEPLEVL